jgi:hypothetical protein
MEVQGGEISLDIIKEYKGGQSLVRLYRLWSLRPGVGLLPWVLTSVPKE